MLSRIAATQGDEAGRELDPRPCRLERRAASFEAIDGILEQRPSALVVAAGGRKHALRHVGAGADRLRAGQPLDLAQRVERRGRFLELTARDARADQQLESRSAVQLRCAGTWRSTRSSELGRPKRLAPVERQAGAAELRRPGGTDAVEDRHGLARPSLPPPQLGEPDQRAA